MTEAYLNAGQESMVVVEELSREDMQTATGGGVPLVIGGAILAGVAVGAVDYYTDGAISGAATDVYNATVDAVSSTWNTFSGALTGTVNSIVKALGG